MAANFWTSSHRALLITPEQAAHVHASVLEAGLARSEVVQVKTFFCHQIFEIVALLKARLRVATTACSYFQRFYHLHTFLEHDPRHVAPACVYLAGKSEENSMHSRYFVAMVSKHKASTIGALDQKRLLEYEMILVQDLDFNLLLFSPHHSLKRYLLDLGASAELSARAWGLVCEAHACDVCLVHPPFTVALGALLLAAKASQVDIQAWLDGIQHDVDAAFRVTLSLLQLQEQPVLSSTEALRLLDVLASSSAAPAVAADT